MSDPFVPVSSQNGLNVPWEMILDGIKDAQPQSPIPPVSQYPPQRTMPTTRMDYSLPIDGTCQAREVVVECPVSAIKQNGYAPPRYTQPTGGTSPLSFFVG